MSIYSSLYIFIHNINYDHFLVFVYGLLNGVRNSLIEGQPIPIYPLLTTSSSVNIVIETSRVIGIRKRGAAKSNMRSQHIDYLVAKQLLGEDYDHDMHISIHCRM